MSTKEFTGAKESCTEGGNELKAGASVTYVCNGKEGSPWTDGGTLPPKATETGSWTTTGLSPVVGETYPEISFPIPLGGGKEGAAEINTHFINAEEEEGEGCRRNRRSADSRTGEPVHIHSQARRSKTGHRAERQTRLLQP